MWSRSFTNSSCVSLACYPILVWKVLRLLSSNTLEFPYLSHESFTSLTSIFVLSFPIELKFNLCNKHTFASLKIYFRHSLTSCMSFFQIHLHHVITLECKAHLKWMFPHKISWSVHYFSFLSSLSIHPSFILEIFLYYHSKCLWIHI